MVVNETVLILILVDLPLRRKSSDLLGDSRDSLNPYSGGFASQAQYDINNCLMWISVLILILVDLPLRQLFLYLTEDQIVDYCQPIDIGDLYTFLLSYP